MTAIENDLPVDEWVDDLLWCPSQCYRHVVHNGIHYVLYLRWRWSDPWEGYIATGARSIDTMHGPWINWSDDVFAKLGVAIPQDSLDQAKQGLYDVWKLLSSFSNLRRKNND